MSQLSLHLPLPPRFGSEDFLVSPSNRAAREAIDRWPNWPDPVLLLTGPPGSGKTHLSHLWASRARPTILELKDFTRDLREVASSPAVIEGADGLALPEAEFFHYLNLVRSSGSSLLITARQPPDRWAVTTPDLLSRLRLAPLVRIEAPDEALIGSVLVKLFDDRQIRVDTALIDYLALRLDRSLDAARTVVEALDRAGLDSGRRISRSMASGVLKALQLDDG